MIHCYQKKFQIKLFLSQKSPYHKIENLLSWTWLLRVDDTEVIKSFMCRKADRTPLDFYLFILVLVIELGLPVLECGFNLKSFNKN